MTKIQKNPKQTKMKKNPNTRQQNYLECCFQTLSMPADQGEGTKAAGPRTRRSSAQVSPWQLPWLWAHTAASGDLLSNRTQLKPQHHKVLEHGQAAQQLPQKGRQIPRCGQQEASWEALPSQGHSQQLCVPSSQPPYITCNGRLKP